MKRRASCFRYHKGTDFQANHNYLDRLIFEQTVVLDTTKVQIFKQITTYYWSALCLGVLFQIPQRYRFSSKSQQVLMTLIRYHSCFRYHKGTDFQANHNAVQRSETGCAVVLDTTKVQIFKQITTISVLLEDVWVLFQIPQRYRFSSKSQHVLVCLLFRNCCFRYHKGTDFQANHN